jgi:signal transduction histidine kinase
MLRLAWSEAGRAPGASVEVPLTVLVEGAAANVGPAAERRGVALRLGPLEKLSVSGDPFWLHELLDGVMDAAMTNAPPGGIVSVSAVKLADSAAIRVSHAESEEPRTVPTPPEAAADAHRLTARARLTLAREIARAHGGQLEEERRSDTEAEYRLSLPRRNE